MSEVFEEQRLQSVFTLRILEMVKHIRVQPLPRVAELGWGLSMALGIMKTLVPLLTGRLQIAIW